MPEPSFAQFKTPDGLTLPGLLFEAPGSKKVAIHLHGNGSSSVFYFNNYFWGEELNKKGVSLLLFNNRGAHYIQKIDVEKVGLKDRKRYGMAYEKIKECVEDVDGAINFLKRKRYQEFYLTGTSTGANKICNYNFYKPKNEISKYVLVCGGDDMGIYYDLLGKKKFYELLAKAKRKIEEGKGEEIISELLPENIFSYTGFYDIANPDGDYNVFPFYEVINGVKLSTKPLFRYFKSIKKPTLVIYGDKDEYGWGNVKRDVEILKGHQPDFIYKIIGGADHKFTGKEKVLAQTIANWLAKKIGS